MIKGPYRVAGFRAYLKNEAGSYYMDFEKHEDMKAYVMAAWNDGEQFIGYVELIQQA